MRNFVAKNDFNRAATHKSALDYSRVNSRELMDSCYEELEDWAADWPSMEENWNVSEDMTKPPPEVASKCDSTSRSNFNNKGNNMQNLQDRWISVCDIESLGTPGDCKSTFIAMPSFAFVLLKDLSLDPYIVLGTPNVAQQLALGAKVSAGTIAFWMNEARAGSAPSLSIIEALNAKDGESTVLVCNPTHESPVSKHTFMDLICPFVEAKQVIEGIIDEQGIDTRSLRHYGNGPQFDMSIYETVAAQANVFSPSDPAIVPWKFWDISSARNPRDYFEALGGDWKALVRCAEIYAHDVIERYNLIPEGVYPSKHDPVFDALVEAYCIKTIESKLKI